MKRNKRERLVKDELIGLSVTVKKSSDRSIMGISGEIIDETKNMISIKTEDNGEKKVAKKNTMFEIDYDGDKIELDGSNLTYRPEDRIKKAEVR